MKCYRHRDVEATGKCTECGAPLCDDCYDYFEGHICLNCAEKLLKHDQKLLRKVLIMGILFAIIFSIALGVILSQMEVDSAIVGGMAAYGATGGFAFGHALVANRDEEKSWKDVAIWALISLVLGPIYFIIDVVRLIKFGRTIKAYKVVLAAAKATL